MRSHFSPREFWKTTLHGYELCSAPPLSKENYGDNQRNEYKLLTTKFVPKYTCNRQQN